MNSDSLFHVVGLAFSTLVLLPLPLLITTGRAPAWVGTRVSEPRWIFLGLIGLWFSVLLNSVPRILDGGTGIILICSAVGALIGLAGIMCLFRLAWTTARAFGSARRR